MNESTPVRATFQQRTYQSRPGYSGGDFVGSQFTSYNIGINSRSGVDNPFHKSQIANIGNATTQFNGVRYEVIQVPGSCFASAWNTGTKSIWRMSVDGNLFVPFSSNGSLNPTTADNNALMDFINNARGAQTKLNGMSFIAELRQTLAMLRHPAQSLRRDLPLYLKTLLNRTRGVRNRKSLDRIISDSYLEAVFGWQPLLNDCEDAWKATKALLRTNRKRDHVVVSGYAEDSKDYPFATTTQLFNNYIWVLVHKNRVDSATVEYRGAVKLDKVTSIPGYADDIFGFTLDEFVPTVWNLLPWSFLVDYFTNIGDILSASTWSTSNLAWASKTIRQHSKTVMSSRLDTAKIASLLGVNYRGSGGNPGSYSIENSSVTRFAPTVGIPTLVFSLPGKPQKWINMAALLDQNDKTRNSLVALYNRLR